MKVASGPQALAGVRHRDGPGFMSANSAANSAHESTGDLPTGDLEARHTHGVADGTRHRYEDGAKDPGRGST